MAATISPWMAGLKRRCPRCGQGRLFKGFIDLEPACAACGLDFSAADSGDGPAVFVMLVLGFVLVGLALWVELTFAPPYWLHFVLWIPAACLGVLLLLPLFKATLIALQYAHKAAQGRLDE